jgi:hypothetical protein
MSLGVLRLVVVQVDEQGIEFGKTANQSAAAEEAVLGQVDVRLTSELPDRVAEIDDGHRGLAPAAAKPARDADAA